MSGEMNHQALKKKKKYNTVNERLWRQMLRYNLQIKISYLCSAAMNLQYTFWMYSNISYFAYIFLILLFIFTYALFNECDFLFRDFIFYGKIAFQLISYVAKMLTAKMLAAKIWTHTPPKHPSSPQGDRERKIIYKAIARWECGGGIFLLYFCVTEATKVVKGTSWRLSWEIHRLRCKRGLGVCVVGWQWVGNRNQCLSALLAHPLCFGNWGVLHWFL